MDFKVAVVFKIKYHKNGARYSRSHCRTSI